MKYLYGELQEKQLIYQKESLHRAIHWLLLYKDPKTKNEYPSVNFDLYFTKLMKRIDGLNELLFYPDEIVTLLSLLEAAFIETQKNNYNYNSYRTLILDAHSMVDKIKTGGE